MSEGKAVARGQLEQGMCREQSSQCTQHPCQRSPQPVKSFLGVGWCVHERGQWFHSPSIPTSGLRPALSSCTAFSPGTALGSTCTLWVSHPKQLIKRGAEVGTLASAPSGLFGQVLGAWLRMSGSFWKPAWYRQGVTFFRTQAPPGFSLGSIKNQTPVTHQVYKPSELTCMQRFTSSHSFSTQMRKSTQSFNSHFHFRCKNYCTAKSADVSTVTSWVRGQGIKLGCVWLLMPCSAHHPAWITAHSANAYWALGIPGPRLGARKY